jgi:nitrite reductase/ring-hydroxylating ferredoxin subunit
MDEKKLSWLKARDDQADKNGVIRLIEVGDQKICLARYRGKLFGFARKCPHAGAPLEAGYIDPRGNVVCPLHGHKFSLENGRESLGESYLLKHWEVENRTDGLYVLMEDPDLS